MILWTPRRATRRGEIAEEICTEDREDHKGFAIAARIVLIRWSDARAQSIIGGSPVFSHQERSKSPNQRAEEICTEDHRAA